jgi:hypothetical protein
MASGRSSLPVLTEAIAGREIRGSWMADPEVHRIHDVWYGLDERHEHFTAPLVMGKRAIFVAALGPAVARVATDPQRVAEAYRRLAPPARRLLADVERRGSVRVDEWTAGPREGSAARIELARELLVASETIHWRVAAAVVSAAPSAARGASPTPFVPSFLAKLPAGLQRGYAYANAARFWGIPR